MTARDSQVEVRSDALTVTVHAPTGPDAQVWNLLKNDEDYARLMQAACHLALSEDATARLTRFLSLYLDSTYAPYIAIQLARNFVHGPKPDWERARAYLAAPVFINAPAAVAQAAREELASLEARLRARTEHEEKLGDERQRLSPPRVLHDQAWWELEAAGYDLRAVTDPGLIRPGVTNSYHQLMGNLRRRLDAGGITPEEYDQRAAEVLRSSARAFGRPLPPEELKRRREQYEQEDHALRERAAFYQDPKWEVLSELAHDPLRRRQAEQVKQELEADRYDLGAMETLSMPFQRAYRDGIHDLWMAYRAGRLKGEEFDRQYADLYRRLVREHLKPLTPEQWKERKATRPAPAPVPADEK